jgi:hypothetical protein
MCKNELFQSSGTKIEHQAKFKNENNNLPYFLQLLTWLFENIIMVG